jgi:FkbM family methyltransferase
MGLIRRIAKAALRTPRGFDLFHDLKPWPMQVVFDVGANAGQSAKKYLSNFPEALIYSFEPVADTFAGLVATFSRQPRVKPFRLALGSTDGQTRMATDAGPSDMFRVRGDGNETVEMQTLDGFCHDHNIGHIDFLKIDTEGHDLEVLKGATRLLQSARVSAIQVEAGMNPGNDWHVPMEALKGFLESMGYYLFAIYEQVEEWPTGKPHLRRSNLVFIAK